jgi:riboflavin synthase
MFTGIIQSIGQISLRTDTALEISCPEILSDLQLGDSVAVNGVCLTVAQLLANGFQANVSPETYSKTNLGQTSLSYVNMEMAVRPVDRLGGHFVSGHVDTVGEIVAIEETKDAWTYRVSLPHEFSPYLIYKGSVAVNGISLTIADLIDRGATSEFTVAVIAHTYFHTNLQYLHRGDRVNIETDMLGKYVQRLLQKQSPTNLISADFLRSHGY